MSSGAVVALMLAASSFYALGARQRPANRKTIRRAFAFYSGMMVLGIALLSPLDEWSLELFSLHMVQHLLLVLIIPPLIIYGAPGQNLWLALPRSLRKKSATLFRHPLAKLTTRVVTGAVVTVAVHAVAMWAWHLPALYQTALRVELVHAAEHGAFLGTGLLFWALIIPTHHKRLSHGTRSLLVFATALQSGALGALLVFARAPLYPIHASSTGAWGLTPLEDQQLAGAIMWIPAGIVYLGTILTLLLAWFKGMDRSGEAEPA